MMANLNPTETTNTAETSSGLASSGANDEGSSQGSIRNQPKLIISDYELSPTIAEAGENFDLSFTLYNTNNENTIYNLKVTLEQTLASAPQNTSTANNTLVSDGSVFTPVDRSNTFYVAALYPWDWTSKYITMSVLPNATPGPYVVNLTMEYEDYLGNQYKSTETIGIPVAQKSGVNFGKVKLGELNANTPGSLSVNIYNTGKDNLDTVMVRVKGDGFDVDENERFIGNFNAGSTETFSCNITPKSEGKVSGTIEIIYEDSRGKAYKKTKDFSTEVMAGFEGEAGMIDPETGEMIGENPPMEENSSLLSSPFIWIGIIVLAALLLILLRKKRKAKKDEELIIDDED